MAALGGVFFFPPLTLTLAIHYLLQAVAAIAKEGEPAKTVLWSMAPEAIVDHKLQHTSSTDMWAAGCVIVSFGSISLCSAEHPYFEYVRALDRRVCSSPIEIFTVVLDCWLWFCHDGGECQTSGLVIFLRIA